MVGETNLSSLLSDMAPELAPTPFVFAALNHPSAELRASAFMVCEESEATTLVLPASLAAEVVESSAPYARITLRVHSSLEAVGLTAVVAEALRADNIPANVIAGYYHDHVFVPWDRRDAALSALVQVRDQSRASGG
ncbi:MAG: ACT domain-containing protein [Pseudomonadota bacterium]